MTLRMKLGSLGRSKTCENLRPTISGPTPLAPKPRTKPVAPVSVSIPAGGPSAKERASVNPAPPLIDTASRATTQQLERHVGVRDFAYPQDDERHFGRGKLVPHGNRTRDHRRRANSIDEDSTTEEEDNGWWDSGKLGYKGMANFEAKVQEVQDPERYRIVHENAKNRPAKPLKKLGREGTALE